MSDYEQKLQIICSLCNNRIGYAGECDCVEYCQTGMIDSIVHIMYYFNHPEPLL